MKYKSITNIQPNHHLIGMDAVDTNFLATMEEKPSMNFASELVHKKC